MRPLDEKASVPVEEQRARVKRRLNFLFGWVTLPIYVAAVVWVMLTWPTWPVETVVIGTLILIAVYGTMAYVIGGVSLYRSRRELEPTEWMRRGGLMASPEASARPDEKRIRIALATLPDDFPRQARDAVETYLAMADDDEKQLCRDRLIREFYERAGSPKIGFAHRKAYNDLRLALNPWVEADSG